METTSPHNSPGTNRSKGRRWWVWVWAAYALLLGGSHLWQWAHPGLVEDPPLRGGEGVVDCPDFTDEGEAPGGGIRLAYLAWGDAVDAAPVILIHGSPGSAADFAKLGPLLAAQGRWVIAPDLPGFGASTRRPACYSTRAHARGVLAMMDHLGVARADVLGWSMGGGVVLNMADIAPERVASITMLAAIGAQSEEGSGSYAFEHAKYALGRGVLLGVGTLVPHFGLLPEARGTIAYSLLRNFGDTDMRPLRGVMERLRIPTLIIAGRDDFLVPLHAPLLHHELIRPSRLVIMDAMHFMPFQQAGETASIVGGFLAEVRESGGVIEHSTVSLIPFRSARMGRVGASVGEWVRALPWWVGVTLIALAVWRGPVISVAVVAALVNGLTLDWSVSLLGIFCGVLLGPIVGIVGGRLGVGPGISKEDWSRRFERGGPGFWLGVRAVFRPDLRGSGPRAVGAIERRGIRIGAFSLGLIAGAAAWAMVVFIPMLVVAAFVSARLRAPFPLGVLGVGVLVLVLWIVGGVIPLLFTWTGRRMLLARLTRLRRHEYWHPYVFYAPIVPYLIYLAFRHRHPLLFTACNPGIELGGGVVGESKVAILRSLHSSADLVLHAELFDAGPAPAARARAALDAITHDPRLGGFPVILKPDAGLRGFGVRLVRAAEQLEGYFRTTTSPVMVQRYHAGPHEVGVLWVRDLRAGKAARGMIYAVTRKEFPVLEGDGRHTIEQLIYRHPRFRCQASTFLARFSADASRVLARGASFRLAEAGNHCQGTLFRDGADVVTPELSRAIDSLALSMACAGCEENGDAVGGLDFGRFDLRFESWEDLRAGRNFGVIELNGTSSEATNLYDPQKSLLWSYRVLFGQWRHLFELGAWRAARGVRPMTIPVFLRTLYSFYAGRDGSSLAD